MNYMNLLIRNRKFMIISFISYFLLVFLDMKRVGVIYTNDMMSFRLLTHQVFLIFLIPLNILSVLNQKFINVQKNYLVIYTNDEVSNIRNILYYIIVFEVLFYILGQFFFHLINYLFIGRVYLEYFQFSILVIIEIVSMSYIASFLLLTLKKDLFVHIVFYILILLLLVYNNAYITIPMTVRSINLFNDIPLKLFLSKIVWGILSFIIFRISLYKYGIYFYEE